MLSNFSLQDLLEKHYQSYPEDRNVTMWAGCNYHINQGRHEMEPEGTAQSMHNCLDCDRMSYCKVIQPTPIWEYNEDVEKMLVKHFKETLVSKK